MAVGADWALVRERVAACARKAGRRPDDIVIIGVTKYSTVEVINEAVAAGLRHIAENRVQSAQEKFPRVPGAAVVKHMIGHLQTNKSKEAVALFDLIQSVDSVKLVDEINRRAAAVGKVQDILLQIDIAKEEQKFGLPEDEADAFVAHARALPQVRLLGVMAMAPLTGDRELIRGVFRRAKEIFDRLSVDRPLQHLSMGMSGDYDIAIEQGATMVRIGSAIFKNL